VDRIVVYKVDRLSRSLLDFARIVEILDAQGAGLVSVTQQLDSSTSMGRLTLNMLFSFAQFEREMIAERTRDKMGAARRRGQWTGGQPTLGFDVADGGGRLLVNEPEAERVRGMFRLYLELGSLSATVAECRARGWTMKRWTTQEGKVAGGGQITKGSLQHLLRNPILLGKVHSRGELYPGEHPAIIDEATWQAVQDRLRANSVTPEGAARHRHGALLAGLLHCKPCACAMTHVSTKKRNRAYRYYSCVRSQKEGRSVCPTGPVSAGEIEAFVVQQIKGVGLDPALIAETAAQARAQLAAKRAELENDRRLAEHEVRQFEDEMERIAGANGAGSGARLAEIAQRRAAAQERVRALSIEIEALSGQEIDDEDLAGTLAEFEPVWGSLTTRERAEALRLLVEHIDYDGESGDLEITFRSDAPVKEDP
jgi:site-specific DNA recombinase